MGGRFLVLEYLLLSESPSQECAGILRARQGSKNWVQTFIGCPIIRVQNSISGTPNLLAACNRMRRTGLFGTCAKRVMLRGCPLSSWTSSKCQDPHALRGCIPMQTRVFQEVFEAACSSPKQRWSEWLRLTFKKVGIFKWVVGCSTQRF